MTADEKQLVAKVVEDLEDAKKWHDHFCDVVEKRYRAYKGYLDLKSDAAQWNHQGHPPYAYQIIETIVGNLVDDKILFKPKARPIMDDFLTVESYVAGAKAMGLVLDYELDLDRFPQKQRTFALQASIAGLSPALIPWDYREGSMRRMVPGSHEVTDDDGNVIGVIPVMKEARLPTIYRDGPSFCPHDVRDFFWPSNAGEDVQDAPWIMWRSWYTFDDLKQLEAQGIFSNVDELKESRAQDEDENLQYRDDTIFQTNRAKGMIEVLERFSKDGSRLIVGNRKVLLLAEENPYFHEEFPCVVASTAPLPFQLPGMSDIELIEELQEILWEFMNQRMDNVSLLNNAIAIIRNDIEDEDFEFAPGEFWSVDSPQDVQLWTPPALPAEISVNTEGMVKGDMQNITGGMPFLSGVDSSVDNKTATGASIATTLAQRRLTARRQQLMWSYGRAADQMMALIQQYMRRDRLIPVIGKGGLEAFERVSPTQMQGRYVASVEAVSESLMEQENRANALQLFQMALQAAPFLQAEGRPLQLSEFTGDLLRAFGKDDVDKYFAQQPAPGMTPAGPPGLPGLPGAPAPEGAPSMAPQAVGQTNPGAAAGPGSPSSQLSLSPSMIMQRGLARTGGGRNV